MKVILIILAIILLLAPCITWGITLVKNVHLVRRSYTFNNRFVRLIAVPMENDKYIFYIPDGSIINNYTIDLK